MDLSSDHDNVIDGFFDRIWNSLKRKSTDLNDNSTLKSSKLHFSNSNIASQLETANNATQTDSVASIDYMENVIRILSCNVCKDLCGEALQCKNGHLICCDCLGKIEDDGPSTCPVCRITLSDSITRSLVTEHLINELPGRCLFCSEMMPKSLLRNHELYVCNKRIMSCKYSIIGCLWNGTSEFLKNHEVNCDVGKKTVEECYNTIKKTLIDKNNEINSDRSILLGLTEKLKEDNVTLSMNLTKLSLSFNSKETLEPEGQILLFSNKLFKFGFKAKFRIHMTEDCININYCLSNNRLIVGKYLFFINKIKANYVEFKIFDKLNCHLFSSAESWTNWYKTKLTDNVQEFSKIIRNIDGKCIHVDLIVVAMSNKPEKMKSRRLSFPPENGRWNNIMSHLRRNHSSESTLTPSIVYRRNSSNRLNHRVNFETINDEDLVNNETDITRLENAADTDNGDSEETASIN